MHELSLAMALVEQVLRVKEEQHASAIVSIKLSMGALAGVNREAFAFAFPLAAEGTGAEHAKLEIEEVAAEVTCDACGQRSTPGLMHMRCTACGSTQVRITAGRDFLVKSVELQTKS